MTGEPQFPASANASLKDVSVHLDADISGTQTPGDISHHRFSAVAHEVRTEFQLSHHRGPLPDPDTLARYGDIDPAIPGRILAMAERGLDAQIELEKTKLSNVMTIDIAGRMFSLIFAIFVLCLSGYIAHLGYPKTAGGIVVATLGTAIYTLASGRNSEASEKAKKPDAQSNGHTTQKD